MRDILSTVDVLRMSRIGAVAVDGVDPRASAERRLAALGRAF